MNYRSGNLILVPFPFTDLSGIKKKTRNYYPNFSFNEKFGDEKCKMK